MKYGAMVVVALIVAVATYSATAWSAASLTPTEQKLTKDVRVLKSQVAKLQKTTKTHTTQINDAEGLAAAALILSACNIAVSADAIQGTWQIIDQISTATQAGKTYFGAQTAVDDTIAGQSVCAAVQIARSQALPPTVAQYSALLGLLRSAQLRHAFQLQHH
jgi:hypothetical protein